MTSPSSVGIVDTGASIENRQRQLSSSLQTRVSMYHSVYVGHLYQAYKTIKFLVTSARPEMSQIAMLIILTFLFQSYIY